MFEFSRDEIEQIDRTSLRILGEIGVRVDDEALRERAVRAGARPGRETDVLRLPEKMVREYVARAPSEARYADRRGEVRTVSPEADPTFWTGAALNYVAGSECRPITAADLAEFTRVADALPSVFAVVGTSVDKVPPPARDVVGLRIMAEHTTRHLRPLLFTADGIAPLVEMAEVLAGDATLRECPLISFGYSCLSPLHWSQISCDLWRGTSGHGLPVMLNGEPIAGSTSPVTLAGSLALSNAEILAGVVLVQLLEPGRPVVHNLGFAHAMDMRTAACLAGSAECALLAWAGARLAAFYRLPSASWMCTDAFVDDGQASMEKVLTGFAHVLGGVGVIWGMGQLQSEKALSPVQLVLDEEVAAALLRFRRGFRVDEESLAYDEIREVVEEGGDFLSHEHTLRHFRDELSESRLLARCQRETWEAAGSRALADRAADRVREILAAPPSEPLSEDQRRELRAIEKRVLDRLEAGS